MNRAEVLNSLCLIKVIKANGTPGQACGVFVSPRRILTAFHVVQGMKSVEIVNPDGIQTGMLRKKDGGRHLFDKDLDVALVELIAPIGKDFAQASNNSSLCKPDFQANNNAEVEGWLGTMVGGKPALHSLKMHSLQQKIELVKGDLMASFHCTEKVVPGWSGSPIFAKDGFSVLSVVHAHEPSVQAYAEGVNKVLKDMPFKAMIPLLGPNPVEFDKWMQGAERTLGFR